MVSTTQRRGKTPSEFVKIVDSPRTNQQAKLQRETFSTSRQADFFSEKELTTQTGHPKHEWPLVILKELIDNALDAADESDIAPVVAVTVDAGGITVADNGIGIPESTIAGALDFTVRVSSREGYVAPDRGRQGNALKTLIPMPHVLDPENGRFIVTAHGKQHSIVCRLDPISQEVLIDDDAKEVEAVPGTMVKIECPIILSDPNGWTCNGSTPKSRATEKALEFLHGFSLFNPHLSLSVDWFGQKFATEATDPAWRKWKPSQPTSAHWYEQRHIERLVAACIAKDRKNGTDRTVAAFVATFDGFSGSARQKIVLEETGLARVNLSSLATTEGLDSATITKLLASLKKNSKQVTPQRLGIIGKDHFETWLMMFGCTEDSIEYSKVARIDDGVPFVLESVFGWLGEDAANRRQIFAGANWSPGIGNPFRSFGQTGEGLEAVLNKQRSGSSEPIVFGIHLAHPRVEYTDRGKSAIVVNDSAC